MKKALIVTSLLVITALTFAPAVKAFSINLGSFTRFGLHGEENDSHDSDKAEKCKEISHGDEVEEEHESDQAKIHEHEREDGNEDCATASPTGTPTIEPAATPTPDVTATATPTETPTATPTLSLSGSFETSALNDLIAQLRLLIQTLIHNFRDR